MAGIFEKNGFGDYQAKIYSGGEPFAWYGGFAGYENPATFNLDDRDIGGNETVLFGHIGTTGYDPINSYHVVVGADDAVLDGFTITGGNADGGGEDNYGGGTYNSSSNPTITNCTFTENSGSGLYNISSNPTLTNCILWGNAEAQIDNSWSDPTVTYSCVQGGWPGEGNIEAAPRFVDVVADNLRLRADSPCIDAGRNDAVPDGITTDLDGNPRIVGAAVDMGAYEFQP